MEERSNVEFEPPHLAAASPLPLARETVITEDGPPPPAKQGAVTNR